MHMEQDGTICSVASQHIRQLGAWLTVDTVDAETKGAHLYIITRVIAIH